MVAKAFMKLFHKMCHKDISSVRYDGLWNTMIAGYVGNIELRILPSPIPCANRYEVSQLHQIVHNNLYRVMLM
jgi:hypothetical protein